MKIQVHLLATLKQYNPSGDNSVELEVPYGATVLHTLEILSIPKELEIVILLNGRQAREDYLLREGDSLALFPTIAGG